MPLVYSINQTMKNFPRWHRCPRRTRKGNACSKKIFSSQKGVGTAAGGRGRQLQGWIIIRWPVKDPRLHHLLTWSPHLTAHIIINRRWCLQMQGRACKRRSISSEKFWEKKVGEVPQSGRFLIVRIFLRFAVFSVFKENERGSLLKSSQTLRWEEEETGLPGLSRQAQTAAELGTRTSVLLLLPPILNSRWVIFVTDIRNTNCFFVIYKRMIMKGTFPFVVCLITWFCNQCDIMNMEI